MSFEITGKLHEVYDEQQVSATFKKREFVLEIQDGNYAQYPKFQFTQDKCSLLDSYNVGDEVKVAFNLSGRPFTKNNVTSYFTNLSAWRIENAAGAASTPQQEPARRNNSYANAPSAPMASSFVGDDELPF